MAVEEGVDAVGVGLHTRLRPGRQRGEAALRQLVEAEGADEAIDADEIGAGDLGEPPLSGAALHLHLIEPLAGVEIAERARRVVEIGRENMRHAIGVAPDPRFAAEAGQSGRAGIGGHGAIEDIGGGGDGERTISAATNLNAIFNSRNFMPNSPPRRGRVRHARRQSTDFARACPWAAPAAPSFETRRFAPLLRMREIGEFQNDFLILRSLRSRRLEGRGSLDSRRRYRSSSTTTGT